MCHRFWVFFTASYTHAASYQKVDGTIVDPILDKYYGNPHPYNGANLEPDADLYGTDLSHAELVGAWLHYANLTDANLWRAGLSGVSLQDADLTNARLEEAFLRHANLHAANLTGADLSYTDLLNVFLQYANLTGADLEGVRSLTDTCEFEGGEFEGGWQTPCWNNAYYYTDNEPNWHSDMDQAWRDSVGILALLPGTLPQYPVTITSMGLLTPLTSRCGKTTWACQLPP